MVLNAMERTVEAMFFTRITSVTVLMLTVGILASGDLLRPGSTTANGPAPAGQKEPSKAPAKQMSKWPGEWLLEGNSDQPCAVFQHGRVLLLVNERGEFATGRITEATKLIVQKGSWDEGLVGELTDEGKTISWGNGTKWKRP
jgi:hypothetical protein